MASDHVLTEPVGTNEYTVCQLAGELKSVDRWMPFVEDNTRSENFIVKVMSVIETSCVTGEADNNSFR